MKKEIDIKQWQHLFEAYKESSIQFDKNILYISAGALGLSMTFIKDIVPLHESIYISLLLVAWSIFTLVIFMSLLSYYLSMKALNREMQDLYVEEKHRKENKSNKWVKRLNITMLSGLPLGLIFLIIFIAINVSSMAKKQAQQSTKSAVVQKYGIEVPKKPVLKLKVNTKNQK